jgi:hypothetical protein
MGTKETQNKEVGTQKSSLVLTNLLRLPTHEFFQLILPIKLSSIQKIYEILSYPVSMGVHNSI